MRQLLGFFLIGCAIATVGSVLHPHIVAAGIVISATACLGAVLWLPFAVLGFGLRLVRS